MDKQTEIEGREVTLDTIFDGKISCMQFRTGYRFSLDSVLLAHFLPPASRARVLDLGTGSGIISLIMMYRWAERATDFHCLELQQQLYQLAQENVKRNEFSGCCTCHLGNVTEILRIFKPESFTHVVCNPPFYNETSGRQSQDEQSRVARHQISAGIEDFSKGAAAAVKNGGTVAFIYPAEQLIDLSNAFNKVRLEIKQLRFIYSYPDEESSARLVLVKAVKNGGKGVVIDPPFYIYSRKNGEYSLEMERLYLP